MLEATHKQAQADSSAIGLARAGEGGEREGVGLLCATRAPRRRVRAVLQPRGPVAPSRTCCDPRANAVSPAAAAARRGHRVCGPGFDSKESAERRYHRRQHHHPSGCSTAPSASTAKPRADSSHILTFKIPDKIAWMMRRVARDGTNNRQGRRRRSSPAAATHFTPHLFGVLIRRLAISALLIRAGAVNLCSQ